uniref:apocytochrome b n=1 Tax=Erythrolobus coxiae TaxID=362235 RepID=UPI001FCD9568|nr:apocytochrome b [Erythrolobus coxiae]UNJ19006.1 apocytochrome b [Erythrolobus coxiae]
MFFKNSLFRFIHSHVINYPTPSNINYFWNFGFISVFCLGIQILSGIFLAMQYTPHIDYAFLSVERINRDVNTGWWMRYLHANGASFFFISVYIHIFRGLYFGSYIFPREMVWVFGILILFLMIITAFLGYILPFGQMSLWGAMVITNLASAIPFIGNNLVLWLWGNFCVENSTLNRFFSLHYVLPFVITSLTIIHLAFLHKNGSNNGLGISSTIDKINIYPYFILKDFLGVSIFLLIFMIFVFYFPNYLNHSDNYIKANPLITPALISPEWYFLVFYAILRSVPHKLAGVILMLCSIFILFLLPWLNGFEIKSARFRPFYKIIYWFFFFCCLILGWIGSMPIENPYLFLGQSASIYYFIYFLLLTPLLGYLENSMVFINFKY